MSLTAELERIAAAASENGEVTGVLAAEATPGRRTYLVSLGAGDARRWLVFDDYARPLERRELVRETASIVALCELAADVAAGGDVTELRAQLARLRVTEQPPGIEEAEEAALALERALGAPPRVASPGYLDELGAATLELERALGEHASPFTNAMRSGTAAVDELVREVEERYALPLDSA